MNLEELDTMIMRKWVKKNGEETIKKWIKEGILDVNQTDYHGNNIMYHPSAVNDLEFASFLLKHGANPQAANNDDYTPLSIAALKGQFEMLQLLLENLIKVENHSLKEVWDRYVSKTKPFIEICFQHIEKFPKEQQDKLRAIRLEMLYN